MDPARLGITDAEAFLREHGNGWKLTRITTQLVAGAAVGAPTERRSYVELQKMSEHGVLMVASGEGPTQLVAVQVALGVGEKHDGR